MTISERRTDEPGPGDDPRRDETEDERLDRNTTDLLTELRVAAVGIQVLFAFLLVVPFQTGWKHVDAFERDVYFLAFVCIATATVLLIAPTIHHRLLFRMHEKAYLVDVGTKLVIVAVLLLGIGLVAIMVLIADIVFGGAAPAILGIAGALLTGIVWFGIPLRRRRLGAQRHR
ncbi:MAG TPA: DUF6328 family protein [Solirubrobacteraceae bacterium]|jgi:hypothetical protein